MSDIEPKSAIFETIHEMASGLHKCQIITDKEMSEFDDICLGSALIQGETSGIFEGDPFESVREELDLRGYRLPGSPGYTSCYNATSSNLCGGCDECLRQQDDYYNDSF